VLYFTLAAKLFYFLLFIIKWVSELISISLHASLIFWLCSNLHYLELSYQKDNYVSKLSMTMLIQ